MLAVLILYGVVVWGAMIAFALISKSEHLAFVIYAGPLIVSGSIIALLIVDYFIIKLRRGL